MSEATDNRFRMLASKLRVLGHLGETQEGTASVLFLSRTGDTSAAATYRTSVVSAVETIISGWDWNEALGTPALASRALAEELFSLFKTPMGMLLRAITIVLAKEINVIRAAFCVGTASGVWDPASIANGAGLTSPTLTVTGATFGTDVVDVSPPYSLQGLTCTGSLTAANTVAIRLHNGTGAAVNLASGTWAVAVRRPQFASPYTIQQLKDAVIAEVVAGAAD